MDIDERISRTRLTADERAALHIVSKSGYIEPTPAFRLKYIFALMMLEQKGLVRCAWTEGHKDVEAARLTPEGRCERQSIRPRVGMSILAVIGGLLILAAAAVSWALLSHF